MACSTDIFADYREALKRELRSEIEVEVRASLLREIEAERVALGTRYINRGAVAAKLGRSVTALARLRRDPAKSFPKPRNPFGGDPLWLEDEVDAWMLAQPPLPY